MELGIKTRNRILDAIKEDRKNYPSNNKHAIALGINTSVYGYIDSGATEGKISDALLLSVSRRLGVSIRRETPWKVAETPVFVYITEQLELCQRSSLSGLLCDIPNIGKTFTAKVYVKNHPNSIYVDCGQVKTKMRMIRFIAKEFGLNSNGRYADVYDDLVYYLRSIESPMIILDEAGDMNAETFLELKALWNATDRTCGWYMMGANGLKAKIQRNRNCDTLGYEEMFSRYGDNYNRVTPEDEKTRALFLKAQATIVAKVNAPKGANINQIVTLSDGKLRRVYTEIEKLSVEE
ncbi:ATP-binding protein [Bacteroides neonati]|uniref:ATP-binding protein n=1 Tax=Bacteroides neonati TaxID=1347393 RepID=UPI0004AD4800|nr:ATP-binding protein [Bacteroides neonati]